jgi:hypothetical protein
LVTFLLGGRDGLLVPVVGQHGDETAESAATGRISAKGTATRNKRGNQP